LRQLKQENDMPKELIIRGLPGSIARDGWWLVSESGPSVDRAPPSEPPGNILERTRKSPQITALFVLILLGDQLFWGHTPGLSLAIFAWCIFAAACLERSARRNLRNASLVLLLATLPVLEHVQLLSLLFLMAGLLSAVALLQMPSEAESREFGPWLATAVFRLLKSAATKPLTDSAAWVRTLRARVMPPNQSSRHTLGAFIRNWAFPMGGVLVLGSLLVSANPVLEHMLVRMFQIELDLFVLLRRVLFWIGMALLIWPVLTAPVPNKPTAITALNLNASRFLNAGSVFRALILFNGMLAVQSVMDLSILIGGAALPEGMSHATYAHRGAYPLLVTALLAGAFALAARPFLGQHPALKPLLLLWLVQNVLLTLSAAFRLNLYIDTFGLTYLRIYALIWMGLVAVGLLLVAWQVQRGRTSAWLMLRAALLAVGTLYACAFVNFAALIATDTLSRAVEPDTAVQTDWVYLCGLGHMAAKAISTQMAQRPTLHVPDRAVRCVHPAPTDPNWREWDFRTARVNGYLAGNPHGEAQ